MENEKKEVKTKQQILDEMEAKLKQELHPLCEDCHFWEGFGNRKGHCKRKHPPWCIVSEDEWCGEFLSYVITRIESGLKRTLNK